MKPFNLNFFKGHSVAPVSASEKAVVEAESFSLRTNYRTDEEVNNFSGPTPETLTLDVDTDVPEPMAETVDPELDRPEEADGPEEAGAEEEPTDSEESKVEKSIEDLLNAIDEMMSGESAEGDGTLPDESESPEEPDEEGESGPADEEGDAVNEEDEDPESEEEIADN